MNTNNTKPEVQSLATWLEDGVVSRAEVEMVLAKTATLDTASEGGSMNVATPASGQGLAHFFTIKNILYVLGGVVLGLGLLTFVWQVWEVIGSAGRILVTLGAGSGLLAAGVLYSQSGARIVAAVFLSLGAVLFGGGGIVLLYEVGMLYQLPVTVWYAVVASLFIGLTFTLRSVVAGFFAMFYTVVTLYATWFVVLSSISLTLSQRGTSLEWLTISIGFGLLVLAYRIQHTFMSGLIGIVGFFGLNMILLPIAAKMFSSGVWQVVFFLANLGVIALATYLTRTWLLAIGMLYMFFFITYITAEYFADSLGWPLSLILLGVVLMGLGYGSVSIHKRYIKGEG